MRSDGQCLFPTAPSGVPHPLHAHPSYDSTPPTAVITSPSPFFASAFTLVTFTVTFSETMVDFPAAAIAVGNGVAANVTVVDGTENKV